MMCSRLCLNIFSCTLISRFSCKMNRTEKTDNRDRNNRTEPNRKNPEPSHPYYDLPFYSVVLVFVVAFEIGGMEKLQVHLTPLDPCLCLLFLLEPLAFLLNLKWNITRNLTRSKRAPPLSLTNAAISWRVHGYKDGLYHWNLYHILQAIMMKYEKVNLMTIIKIEYIRCQIADWSIQCWRRAISLMKMVNLNSK